MSLQIHDLKKPKKKKHCDNLKIIYNYLLYTNKHFSNGYISSTQLIFEPPAATKGNHRFVKYGLFNRDDRYLHKCFFLYLAFQEPSSTHRVHNIFSKSRF